MKTRNNQLLYTTIVITCIFVLLFMPKASTSKNHGFYPGEKLTFKVRWSFVTAAKVTLEVLPCETVNGEPALHFLYTAKTSKFVDAFYMVRDRIESFTDLDLTRSLLYKKKHEGKSIKDIVVEFDWEQKEARYIDKGIIKESVQISENTYDPLSVFYAFRTGKPDSNNEIVVNVADGKKLIKATAKIIKREKIRVKGKSFNTILFEPKMEGVGGVFAKSKNAKLKIWVTDDEKRIPVRIKSKVTVGSFVASLVSYGSEIYDSDSIDDEE